MKQTERIMVIDDDDDLRETVSDLLAEAGYESIPMSGGSAALDYLMGPSAKPDVILLDLMMPEMDGWEFRRLQQQQPQLASIPVVVVSASRNLHGISADAVLYKPVDLQTLLSTIGRHLHSVAT